MKIRLFTIPNLITLGNMLCGCAALVAILTRGDLVAAFWLVAAAAVLDFLDGFTARLLKAYSPVGVQLDSLSDMVSFGAVPAAALFAMYNGTAGDSSIVPESYALFALALFSGLRLAKFNIDTEQKEEFIGLPTPACAILVMSIGWMAAKGYLELPPLIILIGTGVLCWLLISPVRMFSLKFRDFSWRGNKLRYTFLILSAAALVVLGITAIPLIITAYIVFSLPLNFAKK